MPPKQKQEQGLTQAEAIALIAGALAIRASAKATAERLATVLKVPLAILLPLIVLAQSKPMSYLSPISTPESAAAEGSSLEPAYRAHYVLAASRRVQQAIDRGVPREEALAAEQRYFNQHLRAVDARAQAAKVADAASKRYGPELGWYAILDSRTSPECREAHGKNFTVTRIPPIGYPGAVHPDCRCRPGKRHNTSQTVYGIRRDAA